MAFYGHHTSTYFDVFACVNAIRYLEPIICDCTDSRVLIIKRGVYHMQVIKAIWDFFQNEILGMNWLNELVGSGLSALGLDLSNRWVASAQLFVYDTIKITLLLCSLIFLISYIQSYFPPERSKRILGRFRGIGANTVAALLGTVTPFCSCSSIPIFMGFTSAGLPLGVTFSFLISSPHF